MNWTREQMAKVPGGKKALETADLDDEKALRNRERRAPAPNVGPSVPEKAQCTSQTAGEAISAKLRKKRTMNQTEARFAAVLETRQARQEVLSWRYEGIRLKWGGDMHYTGDFVVFTIVGKPTIYEVKGAHIYERDLVRFKGCRSEWPEFAFEMWQWKKKTWTRLH